MASRNVPLSGGYVVGVYVMYPIIAEGGSLWGHPHSSDDLQVVYMSLVYARVVIHMHRWYVDTTTQVFDPLMHHRLISFLYVCTPCNYVL